MSAVGSKVGKMNFGLTTNKPATLDAAGYGAATFVYADDCRITNIGSLNHFWETAEEPPVICPTIGEITIPYKSTEKIDNFTLTIKFKKDDPLIALIEANRASSSDVIYAELTEEGGVNKVYLALQFIKSQVTYGDTGAIVILECEAIVMSPPVRN
jgi:hypothetical protein